jgi:hypothetical protein
MRAHHRAPIGASEYSIRKLTFCDFLWLENRTNKIAAKMHKKHKTITQSCAFCASLWLLKTNQYFEQKATKATKRTTIIKGLLCSLCYLLFKKNEPLFWTGFQDFSLLTG